MKQQSNQEAELAKKKEEEKRIDHGRPSEELNQHNAEQIAMGTPNIITQYVCVEA